MVERRRVVELMERFRLQTLSMERSWLPGILFQVMTTPPSMEVVPIQGAPAGLLYSLSSPDFLPVYYPPLSAVAIGSGQGASTQIDHQADWVFAGPVGDSGVEGAALRDAVRTFVLDEGTPGVGGLYPTVKVGSAGLEFLTYASEIPAGGTRIELAAPPPGVFEQRNHNTGKVIRLRLPWEVQARSPGARTTFNDLDEAEKVFRGN